MTYVATLGDFQQLAIANIGEQTQINLTMSSPGQQQSQSSSFHTGKWVSTPQLFNVGQGFVLKIDSHQGSHHILIQQNSIGMVSPPADLSGYPTVTFKDIPDAPQKPIEFKPMKPMQPMQPMRMGNMSMDINSMSMQMGNMSLNSDNQAKTTTNKQFCSQCGTEAKAGDRFCRSCGHELDQ